MTIPWLSTEYGWLIMQRFMLHCHLISVVLTMASKISLGCCDWTLLSPMVVVALKL